jgi:hypothetical protein
VLAVDSVCVTREHTIYVALVDRRARSPLFDIVGIVSHHLVQDAGG